MASLYHLAKKRMEDEREQAAATCVEGFQLPLDQIRFQQGVAAGLQHALDALEQANKDWDHS